RHRAGDHREDLQARLPRVRDSNHVRRPRLHGRQEDHLARRVRRALGALEVPVHGVNPLRRLFGYSRQYRWRLTLAVIGMVLFAAASAALAALIKPIVDRTLPSKEQLALMAWAIVGLYLIKGIGSYLSSYQM